MLKSATLVMLLAAGPCLAQTPYLDDRSTAEAVIRSLYSAINRHEIVRAYGYWDGGEAPAFAAFAKGFDQTDHVELKVGVTSSDGAAGSIYSGVAVAIRSTSLSGVVTQFAGCYTLRQVQPANQAVPPFQPTHIVSGHLKAATGQLVEALPKACLLD